uniref:Integrin alpha-8-like n=2 Tax=Petromyzon marinus TaxID=7757 RepID=A0AAJ7WM14_PETMA|nr:integrin alpha-8-like [Petromyzon marinus]
MARVLPLLLLRLSVQWSGLVHPGWGFNLDTSAGVEYAGPPGSYFGYAVDLYTQPDAIGVLIGAPRANTSQPGVTEGGAVYLCPWGRDGARPSCHPIPFDLTGDRMLTLPTGVRDRVDYKSRQWFGASLRALRSSVMACAPLYRWRTLRPAREREPVGTCYVAHGNFSSFTEYSPCRRGNPDPPGQGSCQGGFSVDFTDAGTAVLGGPGSFYWQGQLIAAPLHAVLGSHNETYINQAVQGETQSRARQSSHDDSYMGYSVAVGEFTGDLKQEYVAGVPKGFRSVGYVAILEADNMTSVHNFSGEQMASYFGFAVAVTDVNGDRLDDVLVGAPLFMRRVSESSLREVGRLYAFLQERPLSFREPQTFDGPHTYTRFGSAIAPLGDLDQDGYNDVAVGAPFGGEDQRGLVHVYSGSRDGLRTSPTQVLQGQWASAGALPGFGYSLRGAVDVDGNGYPDLLVGAFGVSKAVLYRARPVVSLDVELQLVPQMINTESKDCMMPGSGAPVSCFTVKVCLSAVGKSVPATMEVELQVQLDRLKLKGSGRRALFLLSQTSLHEQRLSLANRARPHCVALLAFLRGESEFRDKLTPISVGLNLSLDEQARQGPHGLHPILHPSSPQHVSKQAYILLDCGEDNVCIPKLKLSVTWDRKALLVGEENLVTLALVARNAGEGAYEAELVLVLPPEADYVGIVRNESLSLLSCSYKAENASRSVLCDLGNPMAGQSSIALGLRFSVNRLEQAGPNVTFEAYVRSANQEPHEHVFEAVTLPVRVFAQLDLRGVSLPPQLVLPLPDWAPPSAELSTEEQVGPLVLHVYELRNSGPASVGPSQLEVALPEKLKDQFVLYLLELATEGPLTCKLDRPANPLQLQMSMTGAEMLLNDSWAEPWQSFRRRRRRTLLHLRALAADRGRTLNCSWAECAHVRCDVGVLHKGESAVLKVRARLWADTFLKRENQKFSIQALARFDVLQVPYRIKPAEYPSGSVVVQSKVLWARSDSSLPLPFWAVLLAVFSGLLLLSLLVFAMWMVGFFHRKRPPQKDETNHQTQAAPASNGHEA